MKFDTARRAVVLCGFCAFLDLYAPQSVLSDLAGEFQVAPSVAGGIIGATTLAVAVGAPFAGLLADRFGQRRTILIAIFALVPVTALMALARNLETLLALRFLQGLLLPAIFSSAVAFTADEWSPEEAADVTGLYMLGTVLGGFSGRFLVALGAEYVGWRGGFAVLGAMTLVAAIALRQWLPVRPRKTASVRAPALAALRDHLRNPPLLATCGVGSAMLFANTATFTYIDFRLADPPFTLGSTERGAIFVVYLIGAISTPASGAIIRRLGRRLTLALAIAVSASGMLISLADSMPMVVAGLALFCTGVFIAQTSSLGFIGQHVRHARATAMGLYVCCYYIGGSLGAVLPGSIWGWAGWPGCVGLVVAMITAATLLAMWAWRPRAIVT